MKKQPYTPTSVYTHLQTLRANEKELYKKLTTDTTLSFYAVESLQRRIKQIRADIEHLETQFQETIKRVHLGA